MKVLEFVKMEGGTAYMSGDTVIGWVLTTLNFKWTFEICGQESKAKLLFETEALAKQGLLQALSE